MAPEAARDAVVVVHGLWMGPWVMGWLDRHLAAAGFRVFRFGYPSMQSLAANAVALARFADGIEAPRLHWLGHSLGGILIFRALASADQRRDGRVVMLGSPVNGSYAAARLAQHGLGRAMLGSCALEWFAAPASRWSLPLDLGIIAGTRSLGLGRLVAPGLPKPNDGVVTVDEARLAGAREFLALPVSHSGMLFSAPLARRAATFFRTGSFAAGGAAS